MNCTVVLMNRRHFLTNAAVTPASLLAQEVSSEGWREFEVKTRIEILRRSGTTRVWLPAALLTRTPFQRTLSNDFNAAGGSAKIIETRADGLGIMAAEFPAGVKPVLTLTSRVATRNHALDLNKFGKPPEISRAEVDHFRRATKLLPTGGIVRATAAEITKGARSDMDKARAIYEWIVDNTFRNPNTRGCELVTSASCSSQRIWVVSVLI